MAELEGDPARVLELTKGIGENDSAEVRLSRAIALNRSGMLAEAFELLVRLAREDASNAEVESELGFSVHAIHVRLEIENGSDWDCPCGSGSYYAACCKKREEETLARFNDRVPFDGFRGRVDRFAARAEFRSTMIEAFDEWFGSDAKLGPESDQESRAACERAWMILDVEGSDSPNGMARTILREFVESPTIDAQDRNRALDWQEEGRFGVWRVTDKPQPPGWLLEDLLTGERHYVAAASEQMIGVVEGSVLAGLIVPFDGIWRTGAVLFGLNDHQTRAIVACARELSMKLVTNMFPIRDPARELLMRELRELSDPPLEACVSEELSMILHRSFAISFPTMLRLAQSSSKPIVLCNTDGEPMELITAEVMIPDVPELASRLDAHDDFQVDDEGFHTWYGRSLTPEEIKESREKMREMGITPSDDDDRPRWIRGRLRFHDQHVVVDVNSRERLQALLEIFDALDSRPVVVSEYVMPLPPGIISRHKNEADAIASKFSTDPIRLSGVPANEVLVAAADDNRVVQNIHLLLSIIGESGVKLTPKGQLTLADGRALAVAIGIEFDTMIREKVYKTKSCADVREIALTFQWARAAGLLRVASGWAKPTKRAASFGKSPLDDWQMLFDAFVRKVEWPVRRWAKDRRPWWSKHIATATPAHPC
ncbi:MAG: hypothetical protein ACYDCC_09005 [Actinomycetota bacterium]